MDQRVVNKLFDRLKAIFPKWREIWADDEELKAAKRQWTRTIVKQGLADPMMIKLGIEKAESIGWVRPPSPAQFCEWCWDMAKFNAGIPHREDAVNMVMEIAKLGDYRRKRTVMEPPIYQMCRFIDWYEYTKPGMTMDKARKFIDSAYDKMVDHWKSGRPFAVQPLMIDNPSGVVHKRSTRARAKEVLAGLIKELSK